MALPRYTNTFRRRCQSLPGNEVASRSAAAKPNRVALASMKRLLVGVGSSYLLFAVIGRFVEGMGAVKCGCSADCWCKRPVLSLFRWVFPFGHQAYGSPVESAT